MFAFIKIPAKGQHARFSFFRCQPFRARHIPSSQFIGDVILRLQHQQMFQQIGRLCIRRLRSGLPGQIIDLAG